MDGLARTQAGPRRDSGICSRGVLLLPSATFMANGCSGFPTPAGEGRLHRSGFSAGRQLFHRWMMLLAYFIVCPWESVAVGKLAAYIFPSLDSFEL